MPPVVPESTTGYRRIAVVPPPRAALPRLATPADAVTSETARVLIVLFRAS